MKITPIYKHKILCLPAEAVEARLASATSDELKVLLSVMADPELDLTQRAAALDLTENAVTRALSAWVEAGALLVESDAVSEKKPEPAVRAPDSPAGQISMTGAPQAPRRTLVRSALPHYSSEEIADAVEKNEGCAELIDSCQQMMGRIFNTAESAVIVGMTDYLKLPQDYILLLCSHAVSMQKTSVRYLEKMAVDLHDRGVTTYEALEDELKRVENRAGLERYVRDLFGLGRRALIKKEKGFIDSWANTFRFSREMIAKAYEVTVGNTQNPSMDYANRVLENWYAAGYTTPEEVDAAQAERKGQKTPPEGTSFSTDEFFEAALLRSYGNPQDGGEA